MNQPGDATRPVEVVMDRPGERVDITWADGHVSSLSYAALRKSCPCAACHELRHESAEPPAAGLRVLQANAVVGKPELNEIAMVGRYALQLFWADGHDTGIYSFPYLRSLCQCEVCRREQVSGR